MSGKFDDVFRPSQIEPMQNIDTPTEPTQWIKDLILKVQLKLTCECIIISKCFYFVNHSYNYNDIIMLDIINKHNYNYTHTKDVYLICIVQSNSA